jgi:hypothetical protein
LKIKHRHCENFKSRSVKFYCLLIQTTWLPKIFKKCVSNYRVISENTMFFYRYPSKNIIKFVLFQFMS